MRSTATLENYQTTYHAARSGWIPDLARRPQVGLAPTFGAIDLESENLDELVMFVVAYATMHVGLELDPRSDVTPCATRDARCLNRRRSVSSDPDPR